MDQPMHIDSPSALVASGDLAPEEDEWEYEYDEAGSEDFYFTLDLTTHVADAFAKSQGRFKPDLQEKGAVNAAAQGATPAEASVNGNGGPSESAGHRLQIIDLHTKNPLVQFDNELYSCYWSTDLGTQFHLAEAGLVANPRRLGTVLDIIGTSQTRLLAKPAKIVPRPGRGPAATLSTSSNGACINNADEGEHEQEGEPAGRPQTLSATTGNIKPGEPLRIDKKTLKSDAAKDQASFLERLSEIKLKRGEKDQVPVITVKQFEMPKNAQELKAAAIARDAENAKRRIEVEGHDRERAKRYRPTNAERGIVGKQAGGRQTSAPAPGLSTTPSEGLTTTPYPVAAKDNTDMLSGQQLLASRPCQSVDRQENSSHDATRRSPALLEQTMTRPPDAPGPSLSPTDNTFVTSQEPSQTASALQLSDQRAESGQNAAQHQMTGNVSQSSESTIALVADETENPQALESKDETAAQGAIVDEDEDDRTPGIP